VSTLWGKNPTILACGHLCEPLAAYRFGGNALRWCERCKAWQESVTAPDLDMPEGGGEEAANA